MALFSDRKELVITVINPSKKKFKNLGIDIDETLNLRKGLCLKWFKFDYNHLDSCEEADYKTLEKFHIGPESIIQLVIPGSQ